MDIEVAFSYFQSMFSTICDKHSPLKNYRVRGRDNLWFTEELLDLPINEIHNGPMPERLTPRLNGVRFCYSFLVNLVFLFFVFLNVALFRCVLEYSPVSFLFIDFTCVRFSPGLISSLFSSVLSVCIVVRYWLFLTAYLCLTIACLWPRAGLLRRLNKHQPRSGVNLHLYLHEYSL
jgi:hypothetical protein